jgi:hypothetical protein
MASSLVKTIQSFLPASCRPSLVGKALSLLLAVNVRHRMDGQSGGAEAFNDALAEAAVDEELRRIVAS